MSDFLKSSVLLSRYLGFRVSGEFTNFKICHIIIDIADIRDYIHFSCFLRDENGTWSVISTTF